MFLLVPAHPGCPGQFPQSRKTVVCVCVCVIIISITLYLSKKRHVEETGDIPHCSSIKLLTLILLHSIKCINFLIKMLQE